MITTRKKKKSFNEMTKPEKAVAVAKDVLKNLKIIRATCGVYLHRTGIIPHQISYDASAQEYIDTITKKCQVCGIGACFLSYIRLANKATVHDVLYASRSGMIRRMEEAFSKDQLAQIENVFEGFEDGALKKRYSNANQRLRAIMLNIVRNNGVFIHETTDTGFMGLMGNGYLAIRAAV